MARRLAPSLVVTFSAALGLACTRESPEKIHADPHGKGALTVNPPMPTTTATPTTAELTVNPPPPPPPTRKRKRTAKAGPPKYTSHPVAWADFVPQNPEAPDGRRIFVAHDDRCYVEKPGPASPTPLPPGMRNVTREWVDCPVELDDAAWDHCAGSTLSANVKTGVCHCMPMDGNPPPPPVEVPCPAKKKTKP